MRTFALDGVWHVCNGNEARTSNRQNCSKILLGQIQEDV